MLDGHIATVIGSLRRKAAGHKLKRKCLEDLQRICGYFADNVHAWPMTKYLSTRFAPAAPAVHMIVSSHSLWVFPLSYEGWGSTMSGTTTSVRGLILGAEVIQSY